MVRRVLFYGLGGALALWLAGFFWFLLWTSGPDSLSLRRPMAAQTDGVAALTGGQGRLRAALSVLEQGKARRMLISGAHPDTRAQDLVQVLAAPPDLFSCCIDLESRSLDTRQNATAVAHWARHYKMTSVRLITSDYHLPRALLEMRAAAPELEVVGGAVASGANLGYFALEYIKFSVRAVLIEGRRW